PPLSFDSPVPHHPPGPRGRAVTRSAEPGPYFREANRGVFPPGEDVAMRLRSFVGGLAVDPRRRRAPRRWTRWLGRNWARVSYGYRVEPTWLELNRMEVPVGGLPAAFAGFRIVQLSDLHCSRQ